MDHDIITLKSGKQIYANRGLVSIIKRRNLYRPDEWEYEIGHGYDGYVDLIELHPEYPNQQNQEDDYIPTYTKEELYELADIMIARWNTFKEDVKSGFVKTKL